MVITRFLVGTVALVACSRAEPPSQSPVTVYDLVRLGRRVLPQLAYFRTHSTCTGWLRTSRYELASDRWTLVDTLVERCADGDSTEVTKVRHDSGTFSLHGDTMRFTIPSPIPGETRVLMGVLRGDTLATWAGTLRSDDYIYVRR